MGLYRAGAALRYFLFSRHSRGHGIHSPFVFRLVNNVFRNPIPSSINEKIGFVRQKMSANNTIIRVRDLGTGSFGSRGKERKIREIYRRSSIVPRYGKILYNIALMHAGNDILELGTSLGISTFYLAHASPGSRIVSMEGCPALANIAEKNLSEGRTGNVRFMVGDFDDSLAKIDLPGFSPSLVFVDGNHRKDPVLRYFRKIKELIMPESVVIFDDINYSKEMQSAWHEIKSDPEVSESIDIFQMGLVFFRKGMAKQNYCIRY